MTESDSFFIDLDNLSETIETYITQLNRNLIEWEFKIRKGIVGQVRTNVEVAVKALNQLEKVGKQLNKEMNIIDRLLRKAHRALRKAEDKEERDKLKATINNLEQRAHDVGDAITQNLQDRFEAQKAIFDAAIARFDQRVALKDTELQILQAQAEISGRPNTGAQKKILNQRENILEKEQQRIRDELKDARKARDKERQRELQQALLDNKLALLENTKAIMELEGQAGKILDFNSTAWQVWRTALFNAQGGLVPGMPQIPSMQTGGYVEREGIYHLHKGETVVPESSSHGKIDINITEPMEVADPVALSNAIAMKMKTQRANNR